MTEKDLHVSPIFMVLTITACNQLMSQLQHELCCLNHTCNYNNFMTDVNKMKNVVALQHVVVKRRIILKMKVVYKFCLMQAVSWKIFTHIMYNWTEIFRVRASSYEPGQPGWLSIQDLALLHFPL